MTTATTARLYQGALSATTTTTLYTAAGKVLITEIIFCNTDSVARTVTLQAGTTPATAVGTRLFDSFSLAAKETRRFGLGHVLNATDLITGGASAAGVVSCSISGVTVA